jgi:hypothetical protein
MGDYVCVSSATQAPVAADNAAQNHVCVPGLLP